MIALSLSQDLGEGMILKMSLYILLSIDGNQKIMSGLDHLTRI